MSTKKIKIILLASGNGSNAENIIRYFQNHPSIFVEKIFSNKKEAYVHQRAKKLGIKSDTFSKKDFLDSNFIKAHFSADFLILAGFLWLVPMHLIELFPNKIINIHPSLLPKFGGKGMFGHHVHEAVIRAKETHSGITIHLVSSEYDKGKILFQKTCPISQEDTADHLAQKISALELHYFPKVIERYILSQS